MTPVLSVLIPTVPSRRHFAWNLFDKINGQCCMVAPGAVEVLLLLDNKMRSVGKKREALVQASRGHYVAFVDDDDDVAADYVASIVGAASAYPDLIVFDSLVTLNGEGPTLCRHDKDFPNEQYNASGFRRSAWHIHAWHGELARNTPFPDLMNGEDWPWCEAMLKYAGPQVKIERPLYHYRYSDATTEASK